MRNTMHPGNRSRHFQNNNHNSRQSTHNVVANHLRANPQLSPVRYHLPFERKIVKSSPPQENADPLIGSTISNNKYTIDKYIGHGSFGRVYKGTDLRKNKKIAIKTEPANSKRPQISYEFRIYKLLKGGSGIPHAYWYGGHKKHVAMVMDLLGKNLEKLRVKCQQKFSLNTVLFIADQMIRRIEYVHHKGFVYRDVKPDNFVIGLTQNNQSRKVFIIDFGLAKRYYDPNTHVHIPFIDNKNLVGTARYASINAHLGYELGRRDDLESLGYVFLYFLKGELPWQGTRGSTKKKRYDRIGMKKIQMPLEKLCHGLPVEFYYYMRYCRSLAFQETPDYSYLRSLFRSLLLRKGYSYNVTLDWEDEPTNPSLQASMDTGTQENLSVHENNSDTSSSDDDAMRRIWQ